MEKTSKTEKELLYEIESLEEHLCWLVNVLDAIGCAMNAGVFASNDFVSGLLGVAGCLGAVDRRMKKCVEKAYAGEKAGK